MLKKILFNLQLFGEGGGDGGDGGSAPASGDNAGGNSGEKILASIPEKAKKYYQKAMEKTNAPANASTDTTPSKQAQTAAEPKATEKPSYRDLIKSEDYREEHKAYMDETIGDRLKKYKGLEDDYGKAKEVLGIVAGKYGIAPEDGNFLEVLRQKIEADDSYYEKYALEHDISPEEARKVVSMERKITKLEADKQELARQEQMRQQVITLRKNAEKTKAQFPQFDLDAEMKNEKFRRLCAATNGDTTSAYMSCHWNEILPATAQMASNKAQVQVAQAVAANKARPVENGISSTAPSVAQQNFKGMDLKQIRAYAEEQRRKGR